jgi:putative membrane protein
MMWDHWDVVDGWSAGGFWMLAGMVLVALIVVVGAWLIVRSNRTMQAAGPTAMDILSQRFARGEITKDEYEAAKRTLGAGPRILPTLDDDSRL